MTQPASRNSESTLCWHCSREYPISEAKCPHCRSLNANIDPDGAYEDYLHNQGRIGEPGKLDI